MTKWSENLNPVVIKNIDLKYVLHLRACMILNNNR